MSTTSTQTLAPEPRTESGITPYRVTVPQYLRMIEADVFPPDSRVELLGGLLVEKMTKGIPHDFTTSTLGELMRNLTQPVGWHVREEKSVQLGPLWRPEPDIAVVRGPIDRYRRGDPAQADIALLIEVADSSYERDRGFKWNGYAAAGVPVYWIVNLLERRVEVYTNPTGQGESARYESQTNYSEASEIPVTLDGREPGRVAVRELLP